MGCTVTVTVMKGKSDIPLEDMDQNTDLDAEDPYRGLKILEKAFWLVLILFIGFVELSHMAFRHRLFIG